MSKAEKIARIVSRCFNILVLIFVAERCLEMLIPITVTALTPVMPNPNAFDYLSDAGSAIVNHDLRAAMQEKISLPETAVIVRQNARALSLMRQAFAYPYLSPPVRSIYDVPSYLGQDRELACLCRLEGRVKAMHEDWGGAASSNLDAIQLGINIAHGGNARVSSISMAAQATGRTDCWICVEHLNGLQARAASRRLEALISQQVALPDIFHEEKWTAQTSQAEQFHKNKYINGLLYFAFGKQIMAKKLGHYMDRVIANANMPYQEAKLHPIQEPQEIKYSLIVLLNYKKITWNYTMNRAENALLLTALALRAYHAEHGAYPDTLSALTPGYLQSVPDDPFALTGPLHYRRKGSTYLLYSVGPDGKDDGGQPVANGKMHSRYRFDVCPGCTGDVVAGINLR